MSLKRRKIKKIILFSAMCVCVAGGLFAAYRAWFENDRKGAAFASDGCETVLDETVPGSGVPDAHQLASGIAKQLVSGETVEIDSEQLESIFGLQQEDCLSFSVHLARKDTSAFEIAVFEFASEEQKQSILKAIQQRKAQKLAGFRELNEAEYSLVQQALIAEKNGFVLFAVCGAPQKAQDIFFEMLKGS